MQYRRLAPNADLGDRAKKSIKKFLDVIDGYPLMLLILQQFRLVRVLPYFVTDIPEPKYDHLRWSYENTPAGDGEEACSLRSCIPEEFAAAVGNRIDTIIDG